MPVVEQVILVKAPCFFADCKHLLFTLDMSVFLGFTEPANGFVHLASENLETMIFPHPYLAEVLAIAMVAIVANFIYFFVKLKSLY